MEFSENFLNRHCPEELKEAVCSIVYAAPYLENDAKFGEPELMKVIEFSKNFHNFLLFILLKNHKKLKKMFYI